MKKYYVLLLFIFMAFISKVEASTCSDERILELSSKANNVNISYQAYNSISDIYHNDLLDEDTQDTYPAFYVTIYNLSDDLNARVMRDDIKKGVDVYSSDKADDQTIYVDAGKADQVKIFTIYIRSNDSNCKNEVLKTATVTVPMSNKFFEYDSCREYKDFELCKEFTSTDYSDMTDREFETKLIEYKNKLAKEESKRNSIFGRIATFFTTKGKYILITVVVVAILAVVLYIIKRKKSRLV